MLAGLGARFQESAFHVAILAKIERADGGVIACTSWDQPITYDGDTYEPTDGIKVSTLSTAIGTGVDNQDFFGFITDSRISGDDVKAHRYRKAVYTLRLVDPTDLSLQHIDLFRGRIGEISQPGLETLSAEVRGLVALLQTKIGGLVTNRCTCLRLGNAICGVNLGASYGGHAAQLTGAVVSTAGATLTLASGAPAGFYAFGIVKAVSGPNAGLERDIKVHAVAGANAVLTLTQAFPFVFAGGNTVQVTVGCDRLFATCRDKFGNANRFPAYPHLLGQQKFLQIGR